MVDKKELRGLNRTRFSTVRAYLEAIKEYGLEITDDNTGVATTPWAEAIIEQLGEEHGYPIILLYLYYTDGASVKLSEVQKHMLESASLPTEFDVDRYLDTMYALLESLRECGEVGGLIAGTISEVEAKVARLEREVFELCDELDSIYLELFHAKDLHEFKYKLGVYAEKGTE